MNALRRVEVNYVYTTQNTAVGRTFPTFVRRANQNNPRANVNNTLKITKITILGGFQECPEKVCGRLCLDSPKYIFWQKISCIFPACEPKQHPRERK